MATEVPGTHAVLFDTAQKIRGAWHPCSCSTQPMNCLSSCMCSLMKILTFNRSMTCHLQGLGQHFDINLSLGAKSLSLQRGFRRSIPLNQKVCENLLIIVVTFLRECGLCSGQPHQVDLSCLLPLFLLQVCGRGSLILSPGWSGIQITISFSAAWSYFSSSVL